MSPKFGPAGAPDEFAEQGFKQSIDMPRWLEQYGLDAFEYQCGRGVNVSSKTAQLIGEQARQHNIAMSLHAPYFIALSSNEEEKRLNSIKYILQSVKAVYHMGGDRVVIHSGSCAKMTREAALELAKDTLRRSIEAVDEADGGIYRHIHLCPELMGVVNQLGTLEEVAELCALDERLIPTLDFGHYNARTQGALKTAEDYEYIIRYLENRIGADRIKEFHSHFSKIEYTQVGERRHLTFEEGRAYGPDFEPLAEVIYKRGLHPVIICESRGTQARDAKVMKEIYSQMAKQGKGGE